MEVTRSSCTPGPVSLTRTQVTLKDEKTSVISDIDIARKFEGISLAPINVQLPDEEKLEITTRRRSLTPSSIEFHRPFFTLDIPQSQPPQEQISLLPGRVQSGDVEGLLTLVTCRQISPPAKVCTLEHFKVSRATATLVSIFCTRPLVVAFGQHRLLRIL
jgi:hypothetical protein